jgi:hypothetical protein
MLRLHATATATSRTAVPATDDRARRYDHPALGWIVPAAVFLAVAIVWLLLASRVLDDDSRRHFVNTTTIRYGLAQRDPLAPIAYDNVNT